ncbi:MAG: hypothetical protein OSB67_11865 [Alphaproteobacteria bacterium]|nr:hypothetical protein [Alphaproteobacteria bacterium]
MNKISDWKALPGTPALLEELDQLELLSNVMELETQGFTVVPPEKVGPAGFHEQVRDAVVRVAADLAYPIEAPAGSMVVWGDHTWHGSFERTVPGLRIMMLGAYARPHLQTQEPYRQTSTQEALDRNPVRFAALMDQYGKFPFGRDGVDLDHVRRNPTDPASYCSLFDQEPANGRVRLRPDYDYCAFSGKKTISYQKLAEHRKQKRS